MTRAAQACQRFFTGQLRNREKWTKMTSARQRPRGQCGRVPTLGDAWRGVHTNVNALESLYFQTTRRQDRESGTASFTVPALFRPLIGYSYSQIRDPHGPGS